MNNLSKLEPDVLKSALKAQGSSGDTASTSTINNNETWTLKEAVIVQKELNLSSNKRDALFKFVRLHGDHVEPYALMINDKCF